MKTTLNPSSSMFFLMVPLFICISIPTSLGADDVLFTNCRNNSFSCGNFSNVQYPFWGDNRADYCGLPDFKLTCEEGYFPEITIQSLKYQVLHLNRTSEILVVARDHFYDDLCSGDFVNNTFDPTMFEYVDGLDYVTVLYDCSNATSLSNTTGVSCDIGGLIIPFNFVPGQVYRPDCNNVIMPVQANQSQNLAEARAVFDEGFALKWKVNNEQCDRCSKSGGECGYEGRFSCFCKEGPQVASCPQRETPTAISAGVGGIALISILIITCNSKNRSRKGKKENLHDHNFQAVMKKYGSLAPKKYRYSGVKRMTKSFSDKLGEGGYGVIYKVSLPDGHLVAVKIIRESKVSGEEFINEVASISRTSHVNIVTVIGFCYERNKRILIYEYMSNGSLDNFIYDRGSPNTICTLEWKVLFQVAIGIARGLEYLHRDCNTRILHLDIKPQNILLDEEFYPKISDFGLAKICQKKESIVSLMGTRGTVGFIAPEIFNRAFGRVSHKADVYSYGMLVLEMVGGRKNYYSGESHTNEMYFLDWIYKDLEQGNHPASSSTITKEENEVVRKMTLVSLWCIQTNPSNRLAMSKVIEMLEGPLQSLSVPPKPSLQSPTRSPLKFSNESSDEIIPTDLIST